MDNATPYYPTALLTALLAAGPAAAQVTLDASWLLAEGDAVELYGSDDYADADGNVARAGADQTWSFATVPTLNDTTQLRVLAAAEGSAAAQFPEANLLLTGSEGLGPVGSTSELYVVTRPEGHFVIGVGEPSEDALVGSYALDDDFLVQQSALTFGDAGEDRGGAQLAFDNSVIEDLVDPAVLFVVDSVRVTFEQTEAYAVDGWGTVNLFGTNYDALRVRTDVTSTQVLEVKGLLFSDWTDVTETDFGTTEDVQSILDEGNQTGTEYTWVTPAFHYPIARIFVDAEGGPTKFDYAVEAATPTRELAAPVAFRAYRTGAASVTLELDAPAALDTRVRVYGADGTLLTDAALPDGRRGATLDVSAVAGVSLVTIWRGGRLAGTQRVF